jgi:hypothetical protein
MANVVKLECRMDYADPTAGYGPYAITTWHASWNPLTSEAESCAASLRNGVMAFFNNTTDSTRKVCEYLSSVLSGTAHFRWFDMSDSPPVLGHDLADGSIAVTTTGDALPPQVAACFTTRCEPYGGHRRQSFYNRQFIGPLNSLTLDGDSARPSANFRTTLSEGFDELLDAMDTFGADLGRPCVYSPTNDSSGLVYEAWVDNAFDIQRRRKFDPTTKTYTPGLLP